ncbi:MAG TPA: glycosyltransferase family 9 protein [Actinomycetota bacterium]|nr:glycosyltransferase family 9 protein [Actinomycetota bacterium]
MTDRRRRPRILLVRPDHLGDILLTLPAVVALRRALPFARLTYLVNEGLADVPSRCPAVDEVITVPFPAPDAPFDPPGWRAVVREAAPRLADRFDVAVLLRPEDPWSGALLLAAGMPVRLGFSQNGTRPFLTDAVPPESRDRHGVRLAADILRRAATLVGSSLPSLDVGGPVIVPTPEDERRCEEMLATVADRTSDRPFVLHPGSGWRLKNWPASRWGALARSLAATHGRHALVVGARSERAVCEAVVAAAGASGVLGPTLPFGAVAALHRRARVVASVDSGATHLAAMIGAPVVAVFGPGDPRMAAPWCDPRRRRVVRVELECSPCGRMHDPPCGADELPRCVRGVSVERVARAIRELSDEHHLVDAAYPR